MCKSRFVPAVHSFRGKFVRQLRMHSDRFMRDDSDRNPLYSVCYCSLNCWINLLSRPNQTDIYCLPHVQLAVISCCQNSIWIDCYKENNKRKKLKPEALLNFFIIKFLISQNVNLIFAISFSQLFLKIFCIEDKYFLWFIYKLIRK